VLNIKLLMGANGDGEIALFKKCKGIKNAMRQMLDLIESSGKDTKNENLVISHCNNQSLAEQLNGFVSERFYFKKIYIVPTSGVSSLYVDHQGSERKIKSAGISRSCISRYRVSNVGLRCPFSISPIVQTETPIFSASASCVMDLFSRAFRKTRPINFASLCIIYHPNIIVYRKS